MLSPIDHEMTCLHEAGHAVIYAMGGVKVYSIEVAPVFSDKWSYIDRYGNINRGLLGACETSKFKLDVFMVIENGKLEPKKEALQFWRKCILMVTPEAARDVYRAIRARVVGNIAGYVVELLALNVEVTPQSLLDRAEVDGSIEVAWAAALCKLLPYKNEFEHLVKETTTTLMHDWVSESVIELAGALSNHLKLQTEDIEKFTPQFQLGWPPSPRKKAPVDYYAFFYDTLIDNSIKYGHW